MNIIITGASKGIGFELAKLFAKNENNTVVAIARSEDLLKELKNACIRQDLRNKLKTIPFDLEKTTEIKSGLIPEILKHIETVDILVNNAGVLINKDFELFEISEIEQIFDINFFSQAALIKELMPYIKIGNPKHVISISSMGGFQGSAKFSGLSYYSASKAALANLTECLAEEYKESEIKFNCLALGSVNTEMLQKAFPDYKAPVNPLEMAEFIYDFALNGHRYFNGKIIPVSLTTP
ncbi:MAG: SDR family oxidoreductase [Bacteroidales bacterium]